MQKFTLDLRTMLSLLGEAEQTGQLTADLPSGIPGLKKRCQVRILLQGGKVVLCEITGGGGYLLASGDEAIRLLTQLRACVWKLEESQVDEPPSLPTTSSQSPLSEATSNQSPLFDERYVVPQRIASVNRQMLEQLSRRQRQVLNLVDGVRTVEKITFLLSASSDDYSIRQTQVIVQELRARGLIIISSAQQT